MKRQAELSWQRFYKRRAFSPESAVIENIVQQEVVFAVQAGTIDYETVDLDLQKDPEPVHSGSHKSLGDSTPDVRPLRYRRFG